MGAQKEQLAWTVVKEPAVSRRTVGTLRQVLLAQGHAIEDDGGHQRDAGEPGVPAGHQAQCSRHPFERMEQREVHRQQEHGEQQELNCHAEEHGAQTAAEEQQLAGIAGGTGGHDGNQSCRTIDWLPIIWFSSTILK